MVQAIDSLLSSEFIRATQHHGQTVLINAAVEQLPAISHSKDHTLLASSLGFHEEGSLDSLEDELTPLVLGLRRTDHLSASIRLLRTAAGEELRAGVRLASALRFSVQKRRQKQPSLSGSLQSWAS